MNLKLTILIVILLINWDNSGAQNIFRITCRGNLNDLDSLLNHSLINIQDSRGRSLLHWAIACKQKEIFDFLLQNKINPNLEDNQNRTPMYVAIDADTDYFFDRLQELQSDNTWIDKYGALLLERAVLIKSDLFVKRLINAGVDVNSKNSRGSTALDLANRIGAQNIYQLLLSLGADKTTIRNFSLKGEYMGQEKVGLVPEMFAPNFISTEESEFGSIFNSDGTEFYYAVDVQGKNEIRHSKMKDNQWSKPKTILTHPQYGYNDPFLSNDENRLYFISNRSLNSVDKPKDIDIWYVEKIKNGWSEPIHAGGNINTPRNEYYISSTDHGSLYFSSNGHNTDKDDYDIYYSENINGVFQKPVALSPEINTNGYEADVFIAPDESYLIFCSTRDDGYGQGDLYISFKDKEDKWTQAINMGSEINTLHYEYCPFVTKDGKYLFYTSNQDIYWVSTDIIDELKSNVPEQH